jgi:hypothetical protein
MTTARARQFLVCADSEGEIYVLTRESIFEHEHTARPLPALFSETDAIAECVRLAWGEKRRELPTRAKFFARRAWLRDIIGR